jgi:hypothetical protein
MNVDFSSLSAEEKASLTETEVNAFVRIACMEAGVVLGEPVEEPVFLDEPDVPLETVIRYRVEGNDMPSCGIVFEDRESAQAFLELKTLGVHSKYLGGYHRTQEYTRPMGPLHISEVQLPTEEAVVVKTAELEESAANAKANSELRRKLESRERKIDEAAKPIWNEYREAKAHLVELQEVRNCWAEYQDLAKDFPSAVTFMMKAYDDTYLLAEALGASWNIEVVESL